MKKSIFISGFIGAVVTTFCLKPSAIAATNNLILAANNPVLNNSEIALYESNNESKDNFNKIVLFIVLIATGTLLWRLSQSRRGNEISFKPIQNKSNTALLNRVSPKLRRQLLRLVNDPKTANRLLMGIYKNNSDRSANWLAEKAIYDLRRGR